MLSTKEIYFEAYSEFTILVDQYIIYLKTLTGVIFFQKSNKILSNDVKY